MTDRHITGDFRFPSDLGEGRRLQDEIEEALTACGFGERDVFSVRLALEEAIVNAIKHGNQMDPAKWVSGTYTVGPDRFDVKIVDEGPGFNPADLPDPTDPENIERSCGRGVFLIRHYMTTVEYHGAGNVVTMSKHRNGQADDSE